MPFDSLGFDLVVVTDEAGVHVCQLTELPPVF
jgi:hypothetical protein